MKWVADPYRTELPEYGIPTSIVRMPNGKWYVPGVGYYSPDELDFNIKYV